MRATLIFRDHHREPLEAHDLQRLLVDTSRATDCWLIELESGAAYVRASIVVCDAAGRPVEHREAFVREPSLDVTPPEES